MPTFCVFFSKVEFFVVVMFIFSSEATMHDEQCKGIFCSRFSAMRLRQVADKILDGDKKIIINGSSFGSLTNIVPFSLPADLIDWVVMKIDHKRSMFRYDKTIQLSQLLLQFFSLINITPAFCSIFPLVLLNVASFLFQP